MKKILLVFVLVLISILYLSFSKDIKTENQKANVGEVLGSVTAAGSGSVYLRVPGTGFCDVVGATNATPVVITVSDINDCNLSNNDTVVIHVIEGNLSANSNPENYQLARVVKNINGNSFTIYDLSDNPVQGSGSYTRGGRVGKAQLFTLKSHPILFLDGPSGAKTSSISDPGQKKNSNNPAYVSLSNAVSSHVSSYGGRWGADRLGSIYGAHSLNSALKYLSDNDTTAKEAAIWGIRNMDQSLGTPACDENLRQCGNAGSSVSDYSMQFSFNILQAYSIVYSQLSDSDKRKFTDFFLNDLPWQQGGINLSGTNLTKPLWKVYDKSNSGTITIASNSVNVTGQGTRFLSQLSPGDIIMIPHPSDNVYAAPYKVLSIESDTQLTLTYPRANAITNGSWAAGPSWDENSYGFLWQQKHYDYSPLCGNARNCTNYGRQAGLASEGATHNLVLSRLVSYYAMGLVTCKDDVRGCYLAQQAYEYFYDLVLPSNLPIWTGFSQSNTGYHVGRMYNIPLEISAMTKNSFVSGFDPLSGSKVAEMGLRALIASYIPVLNIAFPNQEGGLYYYNTSFRLPLIAMHLIPDSQEARWWQDFIKNKIAGSGKYTTTNISSNNGVQTGMSFLLYEPTVSEESAPTTFTFTKNFNDFCNSIFGSKRCATNLGRYAVTSRTEWLPASSATYFGISGNTTHCSDHCAYEVAGPYYIFKNGKALLAGDDTDYHGGATEKSLILEIGGSVATLSKGGSLVGPAYIPWSAGNNDYLFARVDLTKIYQSSAKVQSANRQVIHFKKAGSDDYVVDYTEASLSSAIGGSAPASIRGFYHYHLNGCGTAASSNCISADLSLGEISNTHSGAKVITKILGFTPIAKKTQNNSNINGSYVGGANRTWRLEVCASIDGQNCDPNATTGEWVLVHRVSGNTSVTLPEIKTSESGNFYVINIKDQNNPKVAVLAKKSQIQNSASFITEHSGTGQYVVSGLSDGTYNIFNGSQKITTISVVSDHVIYFEGPAGSYSITKSSTPDPVPDLPSDSIAPIISSISNQSVSTSTATIVWSTNESSDTQLEYGLTTSYGSSSVLKDSVNKVTNHSVILTGLNPNTAYNYRVKSRDAAGNLAISGNLTFTTQSLPASPTQVNISNLRLSAVTNNSVTISWNTNIGASSQVLYSLVDSVGFRTPETNVLNGVTNHSVNLVGLVPCSKYRFKVRSVASGVEAYSTVGNFLTYGCSGELTPINETTKEVLKNSGDSVSLSNLQLTVPKDFINNTSAFFQIQSFSKDQFSSYINPPSGKVYSSSPVFRATAYTSPTTTASEFYKPINVTVSYTDSEIQNINESTLKLYRYSNGVWSVLSNCSVNVSANTITCTSVGFSEIVLVGDQSTTTNSSVSSGGGTGGASSAGSSSGSSDSSVETSSSFSTGITTGQSNGSSISNHNKYVGIKSLVANISFGSKHPDVLSLQKFLIAESLLSSDSATGFFGVLTEGAVKRFQVANNIVNSGSPLTTGYGAIGPKTRAKINELLGFTGIQFSQGSTKTVTSTIKTIPKIIPAKLTKNIYRGITGGDVVTLQNVLIKEGLLASGNNTGYFGPLTESALRAFQKKYNIVISGTASTTGFGATGPKTRAKVNELAGY